MERSPKLQKFLDNYTEEYFGRTDTKAKEKMICAICGKKVKLEDFRNNISVKEWNISHMCQQCQDDTFGEE
jgi:hypothetical protein